jgi:hypothetical protein
VSRAHSCLRCSHDPCDCNRALKAYDAAEAVRRRSSGGTQPEAERKRPSRGMRLSLDAWRALGALAERGGVTRSAVVERLVLAAVRAR